MLRKKIAYLVLFVIVVTIDGLMLFVLQIGLTGRFFHMPNYRKKVLIADNISSHFIPEVLKLGKDNKIDFVFYHSSGSTTRFLFGVCKKFVEPHFVRMGKTL